MSSVVGAFPFSSRMCRGGPARNSSSASLWVNGGPTRCSSNCETNCDKVLPSLAASIRALATSASLSEIVSSPMGHLHDGRASSTWWLALSESISLGPHPGELHVGPAAGFHGKVDVVLEAGIVA